MFKKTIHTLFFSIISTIPIFAQKYSNEFLAIGVGARGQAMGGAVAASVNDATAAYWNPAALANMEHNEGAQVSLMHTDWFAGISNYDYIGVALPSQNKKSAIGLSLIRFGIDKIPNTLSLYNSDGTINYNNIVEFSAADYAFLGTYAQNRKLGQGQLSLGGNVKVIRRVIGSFANSWGFGLDVAAQYHQGGFRAGIVTKDITNTFNSWRFNFTDSEKATLNITNNEIPISSRENTKPSIILGIGYKKVLGKVGLSGEVDGVVTTDGRRNAVLSGNPISLSPAAGVEVSYDNLIFLRGGISNFQKDNTFSKSGFWISQPSVGVGLKIRAVRIDYAYTNVGSSEARFYSHAISLSLGLKPKKQSIN